MLITDDFVFAHIPKAGGMFMQSVIRRHWPIRAAWEGDATHRSLEDLPVAHRGKPVFAMLRNPWAWYLSWYSYCAGKRDNPEFLLAWDPNDPGFEPTLTRLLSPRHTDPIIEAFMRQQGIGLLEMHRFHILDLEDTSHDITYGRLERLSSDFSAFLRDRELAVPAGLDQSLAGDPINRSDHGPWQAQYTPALRDRVAECERHIVRIGGYRFSE